MHVFSTGKRYAAGATGMTYAPHTVRRESGPGYGMGNVPAQPVMPFIALAFPYLWA